MPGILGRIQGMYLVLLASVYLEKGTLWPTLKRTQDTARARGVLFLLESLRGPAAQVTGGGRVKARPKLPKAWLDSRAHCFPWVHRKREHLFPRWVKKAPSTALHMAGQQSCSTELFREMDVCYFGNIAGGKCFFFSFLFFTPDGLRCLSHKSELYDY